MAFQVITYMRIESEESFDSEEEAYKEKQHLEFLQPENIYQVVEMDDEQPVIEKIETLKR